MSGSSAGALQFDLPLGWLAPGDYLVEFNAATISRVSERSGAVQADRVTSG